MNKVLSLVCFLGLAALPHVSAQCSAVKTYTVKFIPACSAGDIYVKWPNYMNAQTYYGCVSVGNPVLYNCPVNTYFAYVYQMCVDCEQYIPPMPCADLKTANAPNCVNVDGSPTTASPTTSSPTTPSPTSAPPVTATPTVSPNYPTPQPSVPTQTAPDTVPVPTPPSAEPTPPPAYPPSSNINVPPPPYA